jgi:hypothetical protein
MLKLQHAVTSLVAETVIAAFARYLESDGWSVTHEVDFCDLVAQRDGQRIYAEVKGRTEGVGIDADTMYGQILRRMPLDADDQPVEFAVVVPSGAALRAALRVPERVRELLGISVYSVDEGDLVHGPI